MKRLFLIAELLLPVGCWQVAAVLVTGINAIVHDSVTTYNEVGALTGQTADVLRRQYKGKPEEFRKRMNQVREENLEKLIDDELILHEFKTAGYSMPDSVIDDFHDHFFRTLGFPGFYGRNMDAWIDCMTSLDAPDDGLSSVHLAPGDVLVLCISGVGDLRKRCPKIYDALVECSAFVNWRRIETGEPAVLSLSFYS